ncbi:TPR repeat precursor [Prochlorococcus sp. MIT 0601]|nr:TPR repeat precursor [Prochlorococcus sp. MIT 0601]
MKEKITCIVICACFALCCTAGSVQADESLNMIFQEGLLESKAGNFAKALETWNRFIDLAPENGVAYSNRGNVRLALGDPEGAILDQQKAIELMPNELDPHFNKGIAEESLQRWEEAEQDYKWILDRDAENASALYSLGWVDGSQGHWKEAAVLFNKAQIFESNFYGARLSKALANYQLKEYAQAESELRSIIRKYPMFVDCRAALTALLWRQGFIGEAKSNWVAVVGLNNQYSQKAWLLESLRWPPDPFEDLLAFIDLTY